MNIGCAVIDRNVLLRPARVDDAQAVCALLIRSVREICAPDYNNDSEVLDSWCQNKTPKLIESWILDKSNYALVAESNSQKIVGFGLYRTDSSEIDVLYLLPEALHLGIGKQLLLALEAEAMRRGHLMISLNSSITAMEFYRRNGYARSGDPIYFGKVKGLPMNKRLSCRS